ncbi:MAG: hypothetical protein EPN26_16830, partial [Rhodospirillales bacterium]
MGLILMASISKAHHAQIMDVTVIELITAEDFIKQFEKPAEEEKPPEKPPEPPKPSPKPLQAQPVRPSKPNPQIAMAEQTTAEEPGKEPGSDAAVAASSAPPAQ